MVTINCEVRNDSNIARYYTFSVLLVADVLLLNLVQEGEVGQQQEGRKRHDGGVVDVLGLPERRLDGAVPYASRDGSESAQSRRNQNPERSLDGSFVACRGQQRDRRNERQLTIGQHPRLRQRVRSPLAFHVQIEVGTRHEREAYGIQ